MIFILFIAVILRLYQLGKFSLWFDEALTLLCDGALQRPFYSLTHANELLNTNQPSILYIHRIIFYYWAKIVGLDEFRLRFLSVLFGILAVVSIYFLGKYLFDKQVGLYSALLLAFSPFHIYYSRELRQYSLISFLTILSVLFLLKAIHYNKLKYWTLFILCLTLNIYMHYITVLLILNNCILFAATYKRFKKSVFTFIISHFLILFLLIPFFVVVTYFATLSVINWDLFHRQLSAYIPTVNLKNLFFTFKNFSVGYSINFNSPFGILGTLFFFGSFTYGILKIKDREKKLLLAVYSLVPIILIFFVSLYRVFYVDRHFIPFISFYYLGIAYGINNFKRNSRQLITVIALIFLNIGLVGVYLDALPKERIQRIAVAKKKNHRELSVFLSKNYKKGDIIIHTSKETTTPIKFYLAYLNSDNSSLRKEAGICRMLNIREVNGNDMMYYFDWRNNIYDYPEIFMPINFVQLNSYSGRIWLIYSKWNPENFIFEDIKLQNFLRVMRNEYKVRYIDNFDGISLFLCEK